MSSSREKESPVSKIDRRSVLRHSAAIAATMTLPNLMIRQAMALGPIPSPYGAPVPAADQNTGLELLQLPHGFRYWSFGWTGDPLSDGNITPAAHDGMAVVRQFGFNDNRCLLIRNHEVGGGIAPFAGGSIQYSSDAGGGNVNLIWNKQTKQLMNAYASLSGTVRNCAGGETPWKTWLSGEETFSSTEGGEFRHGYVFDVRALPTSYNSTPRKDLGRFAHEACAVDPKTWYIYETEDGPSVSGDLGSGLYRFIPNARTAFGPNWSKGGTLEMLRIVGEDNKDMGPLTAPDEFRTAWVTIDNPDPTPPSEGGTDLSCFMQGYAKGGAIFRRLEGCWWGLGKLYFVSTNGGPGAPGQGEGQVYEYNPRNGKLRLIYHSASNVECENPDNLVVTPNGALILCEDNSSPVIPGPANDAERLLGVTLDGNIFTFAKNNVNFTAGGLGEYTRPESGRTFTGDNRQNEWAGACFDDTGKWMFVNIQTPGITFAITGPWHKGPF